MAGNFPIIEKLGGRGVCFHKLQARGYLKSVHAMRMWGSGRQGQIPGDAAVLLMEIAEAERVKFVAEDFKFAVDDQRAA